MYNPSFIRVHRLQHDIPAGMFYLFGKVKRKAFQRFPSALAVILRIQHYTDIVRAFLIDHKVHQILQSIQRLPSFANQNTHIVARQFHKEVLVLHFSLDFYNQPHCQKNFTQETFGLPFRLKVLFHQHNSIFPAEHSKKGFCTFVNHSNICFLTGNAQLSQRRCNGFFNGFRGFSDFIHSVVPPLQISF